MNTTYSESYATKVNQLEKTINSVTDQTALFKVFNYEAGFGKSREMIRIVEESLSDLENCNRYLIVKRFSRDVDEAAAYLDHHNTVLKQNVLGLTKDNWSSEWKNKPDKLIEVRVLIITHQRYINLCLDDELRGCFSMNRNVLIIDEKVSFPTYSYSKKLYNEVRSYFSSTYVQTELDKVCKKLNNRLEKIVADKEENKCIRVEVGINSKTLSNFDSLIKANQNSGLIQTETNLQRNNLEMMLNGLQLWYSEKCVYNNGSISTFNPRHRLWGLENNIILDASAGIDGAYGNSEIFTLMGQERIIDHSNSKFTIIDFNSGKTSIRLNADDYFPNICSMLIERHNDADKTLIICHKEDARTIESYLKDMGIKSIGFGDDYSGQEYAINWFGNLVGRNDYSVFTQCWVLATPNIPYDQYLLKYMIYNRADLGRKPLDIDKGRFKNEVFYSFQLGYLSAEIYQSIKRIQRVDRPSGDFYIVNSDSLVVDTVLSQIKGTSNREYMKLGFQEKKSANKVVAPDRVDRLIEYLMGLSAGKYQKGQIADTLGLNKSNFRHLLKDNRFLTLEKEGYVKAFNKDILVL